MSIAIINAAVARNVPYCTVKKTADVVCFLHILRRHHFIYGFACDDVSEKIFVYFRFHKFRSIFQGLRVFSRPGHRRFITYTDFANYTKNTHPGQIFILNSTYSRGYASSDNFMALNKSFMDSKFKSGELLATVW
jgi:ribosomal protein S8|tara:strand:- start:77 stop:481 length:405 start_codon:yes stop_codon:yes gene_type:complete